MQVSVETGEGTERTLKVQVPAETLSQEVENRLKSLSGSVKIDGFRPGKVPLKVIKQHYEDRVFQEVASEVLQSSFRDALTQENLNPTGDPVISAQTMEVGKPLEYTATFDVISDFQLAPISDLALERFESEVTDADVDNMIATLREQRASWSEVDRASEEGDKVSISFKGTIDGVAFDGGSSDNTPVVIGSGSMIPGFEENLKGLSKSDTTSFKVPFPEDYQAKDLAGKEAEFAIEVKLIEESVLPEVDEEFAKAFGIEDGNVDQLKEEIKNNLGRELKRRISMDLKNKVMDQLLEHNSQVEVPKSAIQAEAETLQKQAAEMMQGKSAQVEDFIDEATRRLKLGAILESVLKVSGLELTQENVKTRIEEMAKDYADPEEFVNHYYNNPELLKGIQSVVIEDMLVDWIVQGAKVTDVKTTFAELTK